MEAYIVKDPERAMSKSIACRTYFDGLLILVTAFLISSCSTTDFASLQPREGLDAATRITSPWPSHAGPGSARFTDVALISRENLRRLKPVWTFRTGETNEIFQNTPILAGGLLVVCSPFNKVTALDPLTGAHAWTYDPKVDRVRYPNLANCRALAQWSDFEALPTNVEPAEQTVKTCANRLFMATNDARLIALDGLTGEVCPGFGTGGEVDLKAGVGKLSWAQEYQVSSPPAVVGDVVVVGSAVADNQRIDAPSGVVRGYDVRSGELVWAFDLAPPDFDYEAGMVSEAGYALGTPNVWSGFAVDQTRDMIFLPTGNPAPDYARNPGPDMAHYGSSVVALRGSTGELIWHFKTVERDLWDFDVPSIPSVVDIQLDGRPVPALIQSTKMGFIFVLHRETGEPLVEVERREVPRYGPLKDQLSPTQPFPPEAFRVSRQYERGQSPMGLCGSMEKESQVGEVYTPITEQWTIGLPSNMGATNWGGVAVDPQRGLIALHSNNIAFRTRLLDKSKASSELVETISDADRSIEERQAAYKAYRASFDIGDDIELGMQAGTSYAVVRHPMFDPYLGVLPCAGFPLGEVMVIDINEQRQHWRRPHGDFPSKLFSIGLPHNGGPLLTSTGIFFLGSLFESKLYAYDVDSGELLWQHALPAPGNATPMSYAVKDKEGNAKQFIVIAAGGDARSPLGSSSDYIVAFAID